MGRRGEPTVGNHSVIRGVLKLTPDTRENASEVLRKYLKSVGGRDKIVGDSKAGTQKKRGRPASSTNTPTNGTKRTKRADHPASATPPASAAKTWTPPAGSWEDHVASIDACHDDNSGRLIVYLSWKNGNKTQHDTKIVYSRCPQKVGCFMTTRFAYRANTRENCRCLCSTSSTLRSSRPRQRRVWTRSLVALFRKVEVCGAGACVLSHEVAPKVATIEARTGKGHSRSWASLVFGHREFWSSFALK